MKESGCYKNFSDSDLFGGLALVVMRVVGIGPTTYGLKGRCSENVSPANKELTKTENPVFDTSLANLLQKYPDLVAVVKAWPNLPEHVKRAIKTLVQT